MVKWFNVVLVVIGSFVVGAVLEAVLQAKPAQKLNALHMQAWNYAANLKPCEKVVDVFVLPIKVQDATAGSLVLRIKKDKEDQYVVFMPEDIVKDITPLRLEAEYLIPRR
ncbi:MAG: hypothetical protein G01um101429_262 [Parcubacteria group bacterium Gr01-1014_29]|nr:MAG: hypothetical protein G01um101429_262 [Parcubacteria group bacterium Gr01-1014_29]